MALDPALVAAIEAAAVAAATAAANAHVAAAAAPPADPPNLGNYPLAVGHVVGDSFVTLGIDSNTDQHALFETEGLNTLESVSDLDLDSVDSVASTLGRQTHTIA